MSAPQSAAPGWYPDPSGAPGQRYFDGTNWTVTAPPPPPAPPLQGQDGALYVRQQTAHSLTKHLLFGVFICWLNVVYISVSKNHYWKA
ncbi:Protein of uncharacterised function (DUF2510) [Mycobacteroides abscessus subsp. bolletii]|nr:Protein of uncharacterised function (DUF2510) [Mycobacteroides abscessus subsp. bolletii]SKS75542.1 Protein of uncharacterised function (DUF2510) [Mycobacteroides abscessus subsp. bolletii]